MSVTRWALIGIIAGVSAPLVSLAQTQADTTNLAEQIPGTILRLRTSGSNQIVLQLSNLLPKRRGAYVISVNREEIAVPSPLPSPEVERKAANLAPTACDQLRAEAAAAYNASTEPQFAALLAYFDRQLGDTQASASCPAEQLAQLEAFAVSLHTASTASVRLGDVRRGERLTAVLTRLADSTTSAATWTFIFEAPPASYWTPTFGIVALWHQWMPEGRRYLVAMDSGRYRVADAGRRKGDVDRIPAIFYSWVDREHTAGGFSWNGLSAGIGLQLTDPTMFIGSGLVYRDNIVLNIGAAIHSRGVPKDEYPTGTIVREQLTRDQLHESRAALNPFLGISIRLGHSPFAPGDPPSGN